MLEQRLYAQGDDEAARAAFIARQPIDRIDKVEEIATLAVKLASDASAYLYREILAFAQTRGGFGFNARDRRRGPLMHVKSP